MTTLKIGLTYTGSDEKHNNYVEWLKSGEDIQVVRLIPQSQNNESINDCDALVLSGGLDMHPSFYNGKAVYTAMPEKFNVERDEFELSTLDNALQRSIPVLGICRGLQLINVFLKGTLVQHIQDKEIDHTGYPDKKHSVTINEGSLLHKISGVDSGVVNSAHHQSIATIGEGLTANCHSDDGVIEGIEWKDPAGKPFMIAIQWHPERMKKFNLQNSPLSKKLRDRFISETILNLEKR